MGTRSKVGQDWYAIIQTVAGLREVVGQSVHGNRQTRRAALSQLRRHNKAKAKYSKPRSES